MKPVRVWVVEMMWGDAWHPCIGLPNLFHARGERKLLDDEGAETRIVEYVPRSEPSKGRKGKAK